MKKHIEVGSDHKYLSVTTGKYLPILRKQRYELVHETKKKKKPNIIFIDKELAIKIIMDCGTAAAHKFRARLGLKHYDVILAKNNQCWQDNKFIWRRKLANAI